MDGRKGWKGGREEGMERRTGMDGRTGWMGGRDGWEEGEDEGGTSLWGKGQNAVDECLARL